VAPANGAVIRELAPVVSGDGPANGNMIISIDGVVVGATLASAGGAWSFTVPAALAFGPHTVQVAALAGSGATTVRSGDSAVVTFQVGCLDASDCSGATPVCDTQSHTCARCLGDGDCPAGAACGAAHTCALAAPSIGTPTDQGFVNQPNTVVRGTSTADANVTLSLDGNALAPVTADANGTWSVTVTDLFLGDHALQATAALGSGALTVTSDASPEVTFHVISGCLSNADCAGGVPTCDTASHVCVRCQAGADCPTGATCAAAACVVPAPTVLAPADGAVTNAPTPRLSGTAPAGAWVAIRLDGADVGTAQADASGVWSLQATASLDAGTHTVTARATLGAGVAAVTSAASAATMFTLVTGCLSAADCGGGLPQCEPTSHLCVRCLAHADCPAPSTCGAGAACELPAPAITGPVNSAYTNLSRPMVTGTGPANANIIVTVDAGVYGPVVTNPNGTWSFTPASPLALGAHDVSATATVGTGPLAVTSPLSAPVSFMLITGCVAHTDCGGATPVCDATSHACVRCAATVDCPTGATCETAHCTLPTPALTWPTGGEVTADVSPVFTGTTVPYADIWIILDGTVFGPGVADNVGAFSYPLAATLNYGLHTARVRATVGTDAVRVASDSTVPVAFTVGCLGNTDCAGATPACAVATHTCARCVADVDCPTGATCDLSAEACLLAPPQITAPAASSTINAPVPTLTGTSAANANVTVSLDGVVRGVARTDSQGGWTLSGGTSLSPGDHTATARATVGTGATAVTSAASSAVTFTLIAGCLTAQDCGGNTPLCDVSNHACRPCQADYGSASGTGCATGALPFCAPSGQCTRCSGSADCAGHGGPICDAASGACVGCTSDAACGGDAFCTGGQCVPKAANGQPMPPMAPVSGQCTPVTAPQGCLSGVCDPLTNRCGVANGQPCAGSGECQSGFCEADGLCGLQNGEVCDTSTHCRSQLCGIDGRCGMPNGGVCQATPQCRSTCAADDLCGAVNGAPCTDGSQCRAGVCGADAHCGAPGGSACQNSQSCRSGACVAGTCVAGCQTDADCSMGQTWCDGVAHQCLPVAIDGGACERGAGCMSGLCGSAGICITPTSGGTCAADAECGMGYACETTSRACVPQAVNGAPCDRSASCLSGVCYADGACGLPDSAPCSSAASCRAGACGQGNLCGSACQEDSDCLATHFCDAQSASCLPRLGNGQGCQRGDQCAAGVCSGGACGQGNGGACGQNSTCQSGVCDMAQGACSTGAGQPCATATDCPTGVCGGGGCALCVIDSDCSAGTCDAPTGVCKVPKKRWMLAGGGCAATDGQPLWLLVLLLAAVHARRVLLRGRPLVK
jgi:hypothetical protein